MCVAVLLFAAAEGYAVIAANLRDRRSVQQDVRRNDDSNTLGTSPERALPVSRERLLFLCPWTQGACGRDSPNARPTFTRHYP
jgi:hypothetical protein